MNSETGKISYLDQLIIREFIVNDLNSEIEIFEKMLSLFVVAVNEARAIGFNGSSRNLFLLGSEAHKLKSNCRSFGAHFLADICLKLEAAAKNRDINSSERLFSEFMVHSGPTIEAIKSFSKVIFSELGVNKSA